MDHQPRLERLLIGLRGLGLLRAWPLGDEAEAESQLAAIAEMLAHREGPPMNEVLELREYDHARGYEAWAETYDDPGNALIDVEERALRPILAALPVGDAADVACGTGRLSAMLCDLGHRVIGIDPSEAMLDRARAKDLPATFQVGSFEALPLADDSVDLVTCALALTHSTALQPAVAEFVRVVRPGGYVVTTDIHPITVATGGGQALFRRSDRSRGVTVNYQHWVSDYVRAFTDAGLVIEGCEEPLVDMAFKIGLGSEDVREAANLGLTGLPLLLIWVLRAP
jgi:ubiquinone/menaquinone biosynthesis C-methylase UbiE